MSLTYTKQQINSTRTIGKDEKDSHQTIQRCPHDKKNPYVMIHNELIRDQSVSPECRHFLCYLLCNSDDWIINVRNLQKEFLEWHGRDKIYELINEAINHGYMRKEEKYSKGFIHSVRYFVIERPSEKCLKKCCTRASFQELRTRTYNKDQATKNKNNTKVLDKTPQIPKKEQKTTAPPAPIIPLFCYEWKNPKTGLFQKVENGITNEEFENLKTQIGEERIRCVCQSMVKYAENNKGTILFKNKNLYNKIIEWDRRASEADKDREQKKKEKELRGGVKEFDHEQGGVDPHKCNDSKIVKNFIDKNPDLKNDIRIFENKIEIRNPLNKRIFGQILIPEPFLNQKLERWAKEFRENRK